MADYDRERDGLVLDFRGIDLVNPVDRIPNGKFAYAQNVRKYIGGGTAARATQDSVAFTLAAAVHSLRRLPPPLPLRLPVARCLWSVPALRQSGETARTREQLAATSGKMRMTRSADWLCAPASHRTSRQREPL